MHAVGSSFRPSENVVSCELDNGRALLDLRTSEYIKLNATAAVVWDGLAEDLTIDQIAEKMAEYFDISPEMCRGDIVALLDQLIGAGLVDKQVP